MPGLASNAIYSVRCSCFRKGLLQSINVIPLKRIVDIGLDIIRHMNRIISRQGQFLQAKCCVQFFNLRKRDRMPTSVNIRISSTSSFYCERQQHLLWGFLSSSSNLVYVLPKRADKSPDTMRIFRCDFCVSIQESTKKSIQFWRRLTAFSHSSDGFVDHYVSVLFERTAPRMYRPICCISLTLYGVSPCLIAKITLLFGQLNLRKDVLGGTKRSLLLRRSSNCNKLRPNSFSNFFSEMFFR